MRRPLNIQYIAQYCRTVVGQKPETMTAKQQESLAASIVHLLAYDEVHGLCRQYPLLAEIIDIAGDLEISNVLNVAQSWREVDNLLHKLEMKVAVER